MSSFYQKAFPRRAETQLFTSSRIFWELSVIVSLRLSIKFDTETIRQVVKKKKREQAGEKLKVSTLEGKILLFAFVFRVELNWGGGVCLKAVCLPARLLTLLILVNKQRPAAVWKRTAKTEDGSSSSSSSGSRVDGCVSRAHAPPMCNVWCEFKVEARRVSSDFFYEARLSDAAQPQKKER